jgi:hypothetical protein
MWNPNELPVKAVWVTTPRGRTEDWFRQLDALHKSGVGMSNRLAVAVYLTEYADTFRLAAKPRGLIKGALAALAVVGRRRGYRTAT